ncbi:MAG: aspartate kinase, partial [Eudoraea sp.]|uniref:aspartate kinase n=1 Tax=Eudoraea sp. TaxID=1979955 RepID=UPI003C76F1A6
MKVLKFGGTSVANAQHIKQVQNIIKNLDENNIVVVVSALGGITDLLLKTIDMASNQDEKYKDSLQEIEDRHIKTIKELIPIQLQSAILSKVKSELNTLDTLAEGAFLIAEKTPQLTDKIVSFGELLSSYIISEFFVSAGMNSAFKDSRELIKTDDTFGKAAVDFENTNKNCNAYFSKTKNKITVIPGFISSTAQGNSTTLGRGGSDYSAAVVASAIDAEELQIWTDVSGMYTANPRIVKQAKAIPQISYEEAMELSHFGAKVLYPPTIQPVLSKNIPILIKNTFAPEEAGTLIAKNDNAQGKSVRGISNVEQITLLSLEGPGMIGIPGISKRFFEVLSQTGISVV